MASVAHSTFACVPSITPAASASSFGPSQAQTVFFYTTCGQFGVSPHLRASSSATRTYVPAFRSPGVALEDLCGAATCQSNLSTYHAATSYPLGRDSGPAWQEFGANLIKNAQCGRVIAARVQKVAKVRAGRGDMLGNNNVRFSPASGSSSSNKEILRKNHVPLYVMLPLNTVSNANKINQARALQASLRALKLIGVDGVLMHVWWGSVEGKGPENYDWSAYLALVKMVNAAGLKLQASLCFHGCGGSGDYGFSSLPPWVLSIGDTNPDIFYTDRAGRRNKECLSLGVDGLALFSGRSPLQMFADLMESFRQTFDIYLGDTIVEVLVGLGPSGELRYPAFPDGLWRFPGVGEFQCYDRYMLQDLRDHAARIGKPEWGLSGPIDSGSYNYWPEDTGFFNDQNGTWDSPFGKFFLSWYAGALIAHGDRMLSLAVSIFRVNDPDVVVAGKLPGIHWWQKTRSHGAELTVGYHNVDGQDGYELAVKMFAKNGALVTVPCMEMSDDEQLAEAKCSPESFLLQIRRICAKYGVPISGENLLVRYDERAHTRIKKNVHRSFNPDLPRMAAFTFSRMGESLFQSSNWRLFVNFAQTLNKDIIDDGERAFLEVESTFSYIRPTLKLKYSPDALVYL